MLISFIIFLLCLLTSLFCAFLSIHFDHKLNRGLSFLFLVLSIFFLISSRCLINVYKSQLKSDVYYITSDDYSYSGNDVFEKHNGYYVEDENGDLIKIDVVKIIDLKNKAGKS